MVSVPHSEAILGGTGASWVTKRLPFLRDMVQNKPSLLMTLTLEIFPIETLPGELSTMFASKCLLATRLARYKSNAFPLRTLSGKNQKYSRIV